MHNCAPIDELTLARALALHPFDGRAAQRHCEPGGRSSPIPGGALRRAAALCYVFRSEGLLSFPLTRRLDSLAVHPGQVSLPGGGVDAGESVEAAAWREADEELALTRLPGARVLGRLHPITIGVSRSLMDVVVALGPDPRPLIAAPDEVAAWGLASLDDLLDPALRADRTVQRHHGAGPAPHILLGTFPVWGATAMALSELAERLRVAR